MYDLLQVTAIHREIYTRSEHQEERVLPVLVSYSHLRADASAPLLV